MKKILSIVIALGLAVFLYLHFTQNSADTTQHEPNLVTMEDDLRLDNLAYEVQKNPQEPAKVEQKDEITVTYKQPEAIKSQKEMTYLQVYQQLQLAKSCHPILSELMAEGNIDFDQWLIKAMRQTERDELYQPPKVQFDLLHQHVVECTDLKDHVLSLTHQVSINSASPVDKLSSFVVDELKEALSITEPKTKKETAIEHALKLIKEWQTLLARLAKVSQGVDSLTAEEMLGLEHQIKALNRSRSEPANAENPEALVRIFQEVSVLEERITSQKSVDELLRNHLMTEFNEKTTALFDLLYSSDPEVFVEVNQALNLATQPLFITYTGSKRINNLPVDELVPEYAFPMEINQILMGGSDAEWLKINGDHIDRLIYCHLGGDCSATSLLVRNLCFPFFGSRVEPLACGLGVETFMRNYLLSPNQLQDVQSVVAWLENQYGS